MMTYSVFVSHASSDRCLATAVTNIIKQAFAGQVEPYLAHARIRGGAKWKEELRTHLNQCDAIITLVTPDSIDRPWVHVEWSPFWLHDKQFYVLAAPGVDTTRLVEPMRDSQIVALQDEERVGGFLDNLRDGAGLPESDPPPSSHAAAFVAAAAEGIRADHAAKYEQFAAASTGLPDDDKVRRRILEYFYARPDLDGFRALFRRVDDDAFKAEMALWVARQNDLATAASLCEDITGGDFRRRVAQGLVRGGHEDSRELRRVLDGITNNAELRNFAVDLVEQGRAGTEVLRYVVGRMDNMAELRRVGMCLVQKHEQDRPVFDELCDKITRNNPTHLRDVATAFVLQGTHGAPGFERVMDALVSHKPQSAIPVLEALKEHDPAALAPLHERHAHRGPDNAAVAWLRNEAAPR